MGWGCRSGAGWCDTWDSASDELALVADALQEELSDQEVDAALMVEESCKSS